MDGCFPYKTARSLPAYPSPELFGAKGDGTTDDTAALQAALTAGPVSGRPGAVYKISSKLTITGIFEGNGAIIRASVATFNLLKISGTAGVRIRNVVFQGAATTDATTQYAIETSATSVPSDFEITGCTFGHASYQLNSGVFIQGNGESSFRVVDNYFQRLVGIISGVGYGVLMGAVTNGIVSGNTFLGVRGTHGRHAVYCSAGAAQVIVSNNTIEAFSLEGISVLASGAQPACDGIVISNNVLKSCGADLVNDGAIWVGGKAKNISVTGNTIIESYANGIHAEAASTGFRNVDISGNVIIDPKYYGIRSLGVLYPKIQNNQIHGASRKTAQTYWDIEISVSPDDSTLPIEVLISGNQCIGVNAVSRSPLNLSASIAGAIVKCWANDFPSTNYFSGPLYNNTSITVWIDGRVQYKGTFDPGSAADKASVVTTALTVLGAEQGATVSVGFTTASDGFVVTGQCYSDGFVKVTFANLSGGVVDLASGTLRVDVWKRDGNGL